MQRPVVNEWLTKAVSLLQQVVLRVAIGTRPTEPVWKKIPTYYSSCTLSSFSLGTTKPDAGSTLQKDTFRHISVAKSKDITTVVHPQIFRCK